MCPRYPAVSYAYGTSVSNHLKHLLGMLFDAVHGDVTRPHHRIIATCSAVVHPSNFLVNRWSAISNVSLHSLNNKAFTLMVEYLFTILEIHKNVFEIFHISTSQILSTTRHTRHDANNKLQIFLTEQT